MQNSVGPTPEPASHLGEGTTEPSGPVRPPRSAPDGPDGSDVSDGSHAERSSMTWHARRAASFGPAASVYQAVRPSYPDAAVAWAVPAGALDVVDLAAGTGKLTERLLALAAEVPGRRILAVEPSEQMRAVLSAALPEVRVLAGTAEATGLGEATVDAVTVGQAWHWFDEPAAAAEIARVLRPGGTLAVLWNEQDTERAHWLAQYDEIVRRGDPMTYRHPAPRFGAEPGAEFGAVEHSTFAWTDRIRPAALRDLAASRSCLLTLPDQERAAVLDRVDELVATDPALRGHDTVAVPYRTDVFRARRR